MIAELGQLALCVAFIVAMLQGFSPSFHRGHSALYALKPMAALNFFLVSIAFGALIYSYAVSDFSVLNVVLNSHSEKAWLYKITGAWGNHEGSMLLWAWMLTGYGLLVALLRTHDTQLKAGTLQILGLITAGFLAFILFTSNPFLRVFPVPLEGEDLNPLLQDIGLALHPPTLYVGYVGFAVVFAYAVAGLRQGVLNQAWAKQAQPWILLPWSFLTLGIGAGSWWAYRELGWGGWWFWDPVENVSLLPWLSGTALLHANMVLEKRGQLARWVALLAILTFSLSLVGTFIVRSGLITSVHAFATDPARGMFILLYIAVVTGAALTVYARSHIPLSAPLVLASRSGLMVIGNVLLVAAAGTILLAILYPVFLELMGGTPISVGASYFNRTVLPLLAPLVPLAALAPLLAWDQATRAQVLHTVKRFIPAALMAVLVACAIAWPPQLLKLAGLLLGFWLLYGVALYVHRLRRARLVLLSASGLRHLAASCAHASVAIFVLGLTATSLFKQVYEAPLNPKAPMVMGDYTLRLVSAHKAEFGNYTTRVATFSVARDGRVLTELSPELRYYEARQTQTTEAALFSTPWRDLYLVIGDASYGTSAIGVRFYVTPGQQWVWWGFTLAGIAGLLGLLGSALRLRERP